MNLIDAVKSGKPFRRPADKWWWELNDGYLVQANGIGGEMCVLPVTLESLTADDWEIEEPEVTVTPGMLHTLYREFLEDHIDSQNANYCVSSPFEAASFLHQLCNRLFNRSK